MNPPVFDQAFRTGLASLFEWRRDVRRFRPEPLPPGALARLLALAQGAPSVGLSQPWRFILVEDPARRGAIRANFAACNAAALAAQPGERAGTYARLKLAGLDQAPVHLAVCADPAPEQGGGLGRATQPEMAAYSAVLAVHTLWLAARAEGIGLGWVSILDPALALATLDVPPAWRLVAYLCLGWPEAESDVRELERARGDGLGLGLGGGSGDFLGQGGAEVDEEGEDAAVLGVFGGVLRRGGRERFGWGRGGFCGGARHGTERELMAVGSQGISGLVREDGVVGGFLAHQPVEGRG